MILMWKIAGHIWVKESFYLDNFQGSTNCKQKLLQIYCEAKKEMKSVNMPLCMWVSNDFMLNNKIERDFINYNAPSITNILGINWLVKIDVSNIIKKGVIMSYFYYIWSIVFNSTYFSSGKTFSSKGWEKLFMHRMISCLRATLITVIS